MRNCGPVIVTGCAGFIGSNLVERLLDEGHLVTGIDNFSTGQRRFLERSLENESFRLIECDLLDLASLGKAFDQGDAVFHLAANADVRFGTEQPRKDLEQNTIATYNVLEAMRANGIKRIVFSSTGSVYGEAAVIPTPEDGPFPIQTSLYGASKLAGEGLISAYCEGFGFHSQISPEFTRVFQPPRILICCPWPSRIKTDWRPGRPFQGLHWRPHPTQCPCTAAIQSK